MDKRTDEISSIIGETLHTGLRKWAESPASRDAWVAIQDMPDGEWNSIVDVAATRVVEYLGMEREQPELHSWH